jgi:hypothetical protein
MPRENSIDASVDGGRDVAEDKKNNQTIGITSEWRHP